MPTYTYRCDACGHQFDKFQRISESALTECPECQDQLRKVYHPVGVVFKGSGWYITDSRKSTGSENGGSDKTENAAAKDGKDGKDGKPSETAKAAKTESAETTASKSKASTTSES
jgi:putative FmdB family regulatory protein